jgi:hypothetical protein
MVNCYNVLHVVIIIFVQLPVFKGYQMNKTQEALAESKREWVGLSDEEVQTIFELGHHSYKEFAKAIEVKLKELNT